MKPFRGQRPDTSEAISCMHVFSGKFHRINGNEVDKVARIKMLHPPGSDAGHDSAGRLCACIRTPMYVLYLCIRMTAFRLVRISFSKRGENRNIPGIREPIEHSEALVIVPHGCRKPLSEVRSRETNACIRVQLHGGKLALDLQGAGFACEKRTRFSMPARCASYHAIRPVAGVCT